jgi:hypothetical protein
MTTVINFNILNFFKSGLDKYRLYDAPPNKKRSEEKHNPSTGRNRIIDVTQSSRVVTYENEPEAYVRNARPALSVLPDRRMTETYDRRGRAIQFISHKGLNVDSYV